MYKIKTTFKKTRGKKNKRVAHGMGEGLGGIRSNKITINELLENLTDDAVA